MKNTRCKSAEFCQNRRSLPNGQRVGQRLRTSKKDAECLECATWGKLKHKDTY